MATHSRSLPRRGGAWGVSAIGAILLIAALAYGTRAIATGSTTLYPTVQAVVLVVLCGTVVVTGYWLQQSDLPDGDRWRIAIWVSLGIILLVGLTTWQLLTQVRGGATLRNPLLTLVVTQTVGATAGLLVGIYHVQSLRNARAAEQATAAATEAKAAQDQLAFVHTLVRHHMRNGMHVIQSYVRHLEPHVDDEGQSHLATIQRRSERLVRLVDEMQPLAKALEADGRLAAMDLDAIVEREATHFEITHPASEITVETPAEGATVQADSLLSAAIENLLRSAIERSGVRGPTVTVQIDREKDCWTVEITASGPAVDGGIDQRFLETARESLTDGGDVDVHVAREVLQRYDGTLSVDRNGYGPRFVATLPSADSE